MGYKFLKNLLTQNTHNINMSNEETNVTEPQED